jgi:ribosomal protein S27AE
MAEEAIELAKKPDGKIKIVERIKGETSRTTLLDPVKGGAALKSVFNKDNELIFQELVKLPDGGMNELIDQIIKDKKCVTISRQYIEIKLNKKCPKCGNSPLSRHLDKVELPSEVPVIPLLICDSCKTRSYHLTDEYLKRLVESNPGLFEPDEIAEKGRDEKAFMEELKANIIRIFASQRIMNVK